MRATKLIKPIKNLPYSQRLKILNLPTLIFRRIRGDIIEVYKIITGKYDKLTTVPINFVTSSITRGNRYKIGHSHFRYDLRKYYLVNRIIGLWNSLPDHVVEAETVNCFKKRLDRFLTNQSLYYNWEDDLTGIGSR